MEEKPVTGEAVPLWYSALGLPVDWETFSTPAADGGYKPRVQDLKYSLITTLVMLISRFLLEQLLLRPMGKRLGMSERQTGQSEAFRALASKLESHFLRCSRPNQQQLQQLQQQTGIRERTISNWFRQRRNQRKPSPLNRFTEAAWQVIYYSIFCVVGVVALKDEPCLWDSQWLWRDWLQHTLSPVQFWYYMLELGFYLSSILTLTVDVKRKDFMEMVVHHAVTVMLILCSWSLNFTKIGMMTLLIHDVADPLLNAAKIGQYLKSKKVLNLIMVMFTVVWVVSRLILFPVRLVYSVWAHSLVLVQVPPCTPYYIVLFGYITLQLLHCVWSWFIMQAIIQNCRAGELRDLRSDSELSDVDLKDD